MAAGDPDHVWLRITADALAGTACGLAMLSNDLAFEVGCQRIDLE